MEKKVEIIQKEEVFKRAIFHVEQATLRHEKFDGTMSEDIVRLSLERGDAVAAVLHDTATDTVALIEQFRYPAYTKGPGWLLELPAGMIDGDEPPEDAVQREILEEIGYSVQTLHFIATFYLTPGGSSERLHLYYARVSSQDKTGDGGGIVEEGEDIRTLFVPIDTALGYIGTDARIDAKTIIGLQWLQINRADLPGAHKAETKARRKSSP